MNRSIGSQVLVQEVDQVLPENLAREEGPSISVMSPFRDQDYKTASPTKGRGLAGKNLGAQSLKPKPTSESHATDSNILVSPMKKSTVSVISPAYNSKEKSRERSKKYST